MLNTNKQREISLAVQLAHSKNFERDCQSNH